MTGAANNERQDAFIKEVTVGTTPATPGFKLAPFDTLQMAGNPRISEARLIAFGGQRSGIAHNGNAVAGSASGKLLYGEYDDFFESMFQDQWATEVIINDTEQYSLSIEQAIPQGVGAALTYNRFLGCEAVSGSIVITAGSDVEVNFDILGLTASNSTTTAIAGATYADPVNTNVLGSGDDIGEVDLGVLGTTDCIQNLTIDWGVESKDEQLRISSSSLCGINRGVMRPVITGQFYVEDNFLAIYNAALDGTEFALTIPLGIVTTEKYTIEFPKCEFVEAPLLTSLDGPAFQPFRILPIYDATTVGTCKMTRAVV